MDYKPNVANVLALLKEHGPMTGAELASFFMPHLKRNVSRVVSDIRARAGEKKIYIKEWVHKSELSEKFYPRAVYALGNKPDAPKPRRLTGAQVTERYRQRMRTIRTAHKRVPTSVFNLGDFV